jgi:hypothetical protein
MHNEYVTLLNIQVGVVFCISIDLFNPCIITSLTSLDIGLNVSLIVY